MVSVAPSSSKPYSQSSQLQAVGTLQEKDNHGNFNSSPDIQLMIASQHVVDDAVVSNKHVRIYTIIFDADQSDGMAPLVYAEDMSRNGTYWNGSLIGKGNGGVLLSDGDTLRISPRIYYSFHPLSTRNEEPSFDLVQECEMKYFERQYTVSNRKLGCGACGEVFMAIEQSRRIQLACKIVDLRRLKCPPHVRMDRPESTAGAEDVYVRPQVAKIKSRAQGKQTENRIKQHLRVYHREAAILASLSHPNVISIEKVFITDNSMSVSNVALWQVADLSSYVFQDLITGGDLFSFLERKNGRLSDIEAAVIIRQVLIALEYLHDQNVVHRDLKPENILMTSLANGCRVVLTDFGHAKKIDNDLTRMTTMAGTEQYIAPEICRGGRHFNDKNGYTKAVDMWSLGCVTVVLLTGGSPFMNQKTNQYCQKLAHECDLQQLDHVAEWHLVGKRPKDFVRRLLVLDEKDRMGAKEAKGHCWFSNDFHRLDFEEVYHRAVKHWKPRTLRSPVIEVIDVERVKELSVLQNRDPLEQRKYYQKHLVPMDPPHKPCSRRTSLSLLPKPRSNLSVTISDRIKAVGEETRSSGRMHGKVWDADEDAAPAFISNTGATKLDQPQDGQSSPQEPNKAASHTPLLCLASSSIPLVREPMNLTESGMPKDDEVPGLPTTKEHTNLAIGKLSYSSAPTEPNHPTRSSHLSEPQMSQVPVEYSAGNKCHSDNLTTTVAEDKIPHTVGAAQRYDSECVAHQITEVIPANKLSELQVYHSSQHGKPRAERQAPRVGEHRQDLAEATCSSAHGTNSVVAFDGRLLLHTYPAVPGKENGQSSPRSPIQSRLKMICRRAPKMKRRRGSIYDLDPDEEPDQSQYGLKRLTINSDSTTFWSSTVRKKARTEHHDEL